MDKEKIKELELKVATLNAEIVELKKLTALTKTDEMSNIDGRITFSIFGIKGRIEVRNGGMYEGCSIWLHPLFTWKIVNDDCKTQCLTITGME